MKAQKVSKCVNILWVLSSFVIFLGIISVVGLIYVNITYYRYENLMQFRQIYGDIVSSFYWILVIYLSLSWGLLIHIVYRGYGMGTLPNEFRALGQMSFTIVVTYFFLTIYYAIFGYFYLIICKTFVRWLIIPFLTFTEDSIIVIAVIRLYWKTECTQLSIEAKIEDRLIDGDKTIDINKTHSSLEVKDQISVKDDEEVSTIEYPPE